MRGDPEVVERCRDHCGGTGEKFVGEGCGESDFVANIHWPLPAWVIFDGMVVSRYWWLLHSSSARRNEVRGASPATPRTVGAAGTAESGVYSPRWSCPGRPLSDGYRAGRRRGAPTDWRVSLACTWASLGLPSPSLSWGRASVRPCGSSPHGRHSLLPDCGHPPRDDPTDRRPGRRRPRLAAGTRGGQSASKRRTSKRRT